VTATADQPSPDQPAKNPMADTVSAFLGRFGLARSSTQEDITSLVTKHLAERNISATVKSTRYGELVLEASQQAAALLRYETDALLALIEASFPGTVSSVRIHTLRQPR